MLNEESKKNVVGKIYERPWGTYETLALGDNYQVKRILVNPSGILSLQKHFKRAEHWVIVSGSPTVVVGNIEKELHKGEHVYISIEEVHRIKNTSNEPVVFIEVQCGDYLGEDDILRLEDVYDRA